MQLFRLAGAPLSDRDVVFAYSRSTALATFLSLLAAALAVLALSAAHNVWLGYFVGGFCVLCLLIYQKSVTARLRPSNWLVSSNDNGLFIKFRSYLNCHFSPKDYAVVYIPYAEIRSARHVDEKKQVADVDESRQPMETNRRLRWLELELDGDTRQLAIARANEIDTMLAKTRIGREKPSTRYHHLPVKLSLPNKLRIEWGVKPKIEIILEQLTRHTMVRGAESVINDFTQLDMLSRSEQESRLLELAECGDMIGAIATARKLYGYEPTEAKNFVESLMLEQSQGRPSGPK